MARTAKPPAESESARPGRRRAVPLLALAAGAVVALAVPVAPASAGTAGADAALGKRLKRIMSSSGPFSGAFVANASDSRTVLRHRHRRARILASNVKLYTTASALARFGARGRLATEVLGDGQLAPDGTFTGTLFLRGGGDPTFGSHRFARRSYGSGASVETLARRLEEAGIRRVEGRVRGDESRFDAHRGGPASGYRTSVYVGPLSALSFNRGLANARGSAFQTRPAQFAAARLHAALARRGIRVSARPRTGPAPGRARLLAVVESPAMARLAGVANKPSDNFFAEMLLKSISLQATGKGTTRRGARLVARFARRLRAGARLVDGSGLSRGNRASPLAVARLLLAMREREEFPHYHRSLAVAGRDGTLRRRMRRGPARRRCRGKTGTLRGVSTLSGYCTARSGDVYVFSILMNGVSPYSARRLQDRTAQAIAAVR